MIFGITLMGTSFICFSIEDYIYNPPLFACLVLLTRLLSGYCHSVIYTTSCSILMNVYPKDKENLMGQLQVSLGLGAMAGPLLGSILFTFFGYKLVYFFMSLIFFTQALLSMIFLVNVENDFVETEAYLDKT